MSLEVAFQGYRGAFSEMALLGLYGKSAHAMPCVTFQQAFDAVGNGDADRAVIPVSNQIKGHPSEVPNLLREFTSPSRGHKRLHIVDEFAQSIDICAVMHWQGNLDDGLVKEVIGHPVAIEQASEFLNAHGDLEVIRCEGEQADTAGAAKFISELTDKRDQKTFVAISTPLAAKKYPDLKIVERNIENKNGNWTHFYSFSRKPNKVAALEARGGDIVSLFALKTAKDVYKDGPIQNCFDRNGVDFIRFTEYKDAPDQGLTDIIFETAGHTGNRKTLAALDELKQDGVIEKYTAIGMHTTRSNKVFGRQQYRWK